MTRTAIRRAIASTVVVVAIVAAIAPLSAIIIINGKTGLFGVATDQTIRVSILNAAAKGGINPCVGVFDINGVLLAEVEGRALHQGEGTFIDFDAAALGLREAIRTQLRVEVELGPARLRAEDVVLTLEVFDNDTGKTVFVAPWVLKGFNPQPEPPARR